MIAATEITLKNGDKVLLDDDIVEKLKELSEKRYHSIHWGSRKDYLILHIQIPIHHLAVGIDNIPKDKFVDHINGNILDNRRSNLRICTHQQNCVNKPSTKEGYKGIYKLPSGRYQARISNKSNKSKPVICIGTFDTENEAAEAYNKKALELHGEFARLNVIR